MKILLINPPVRTWAPPNCFPQGLGYVAQALRAEHDVGVLDLNINRVPVEKIDFELEDVDAVGVTGLITNYQWVKDFIQLIHSIKSIPVIVGGPLGSSIPEIMLRKAGTDVCVIGEGEFTAIELFKELGKVADWRNIKEAKIKGIAYLYEDHFVVEEPRQPIRDVNALSLPAYDLFPTEIYAENPCGSAINRDKWGAGGTEYDVPKSMNILSSRGCPNHCWFCAHDFFGMRYRFRSPQSLFDEIVYLYENYGVKFILMGDDAFIVNRRNVEVFCDLMLFSGMNEIIKWEAAGRVDVVTKPLLEKMKRAGCALVGYGVESGSQRMLDRLNKGVTVEQCHRAVELAQEVFGECETTFIVGTPGENRETIKETVDFCKGHNLNPMAVFFLTPYPGAPMWEWMRQEGYFKTLDEEEELCLKLSDNEQGENIVVNFTDFSDEELYEIKREIVEELGAWNKEKH